MKKEFGCRLHDIELLAAGVLGFQPVIKVFKCEPVLHLFRLGRPGPFAHGINVLLRLGLGLGLGLWLGLG